MGLAIQCDKCGAYFKACCKNGTLDINVKVYEDFQTETKLLYLCKTCSDEVKKWFENSDNDNVEEFVNKDIGRLVDVNQVIRIVDKHTKENNELDDDISCILEQASTFYPLRKIKQYLLSELVKVNDHFDKDYKSWGKEYREGFKDALNRVLRKIDQYGG